MAVGLGTQSEQNKEEPSEEREAVAVEMKLSLSKEGDVIISTEDQNGLYISDALFMLELAKMKLVAQHFGTLQAQSGQQGEEE